MQVADILPLQGIKTCPQIIAHPLSFCFATSEPESKV